MEPTDLTVKILQEIREEIRGTNSRMDKLGADMDARFEVIETTLRDLAGQMVILARGIKDRTRSSFDR